MKMKAVKKAIKGIKAKLPKVSRPSWDEYFMNISEMVGTRATCDRGRSGCIVVRKNRILATGYVGSPSGVPHCDEVGHEMHTVINDDTTRSQHCIRTTHAEQNVIAQAARMGIALEGGTIYVHMMPCYACAKMIITAGIKKVVAMKDYHAASKSKRVFKEAGVQFEIITTDMEIYKNM